MNVAAWLNRLGLGQYEQIFNENDIDAEVLLEPTAEDLMGLGVSSIGYPRKLLAAIAVLCEQPAVATEKTAPITPPATAEYGDRNRAGHRPAALIQNGGKFVARNISSTPPHRPARPFDGPRCAKSGSDLDDLLAYIARRARVTRLSLEPAFSLGSDLIQMPARAGLVHGTP